MLKRSSLVLVIIGTLISGCAMFQSIIKSSFPYTTTLVIPATSRADAEYSAISMATSFDQNFSKDGNNGANISQVRIISARLKATEPTNYNIGDIAEVRVYMGRANGKDEVLVATRNDISRNVGNSIVLDIDNSQFLDELVRQPNIRVRMVYKLRKTFGSDVSLHIILGLGAYPAN